MRRPVAAQRTRTRMTAKPADTVTTAKQIAAAGNDLLKEGAARVETYGDKALAFAVDKGPAILAALAILFLGWVIAGWLRRTILRAAVRAKVDLTLAKFLSNVAKWAVLVFAVITCLGTFGINTTGFAAILGTAGLAIGLALQGNLSNLASGVLLLIFRPFKIGDTVIVAGQTGVVDGIDLFTTNLDTGDNRRIIVPNGAIFGGVIENQTRHLTRQVLVNVPISGAADMTITRDTLTRAVDRVVRAGEGALGAPTPSVVMAELHPLVWTVGLWADTPRYAAVRQSLLREIKLGVDEMKIGPPPQVMEVRVTSMPK